MKTKILLINLLIKKFSFLMKEKFVPFFLFLLNQFLLFFSFCYYKRENIKKDGLNRPTSLFLPKGIIKQTRNK